MLCAVMPCYKEPLLGWTNNVYGFTGILYEHALGLIKVVYANKKCIPCIAPGDYTANALILSGYYANRSW